MDRDTLVDMVSRYTRKDSEPCRAGGSGPKRSLKILLVDDSEVACKAMTKLLETAGHQVRMAFNGQAALQTAQDFSADAVILDFRLPDIGGYELLHQLKSFKTLEKAKFLALSGFAREEIQDPHAPVDFDHFVTKPMNVSYVESLL